jgi:hypothetical protein
MSLKTWRYQDKRGISGMELFYPVCIHGSGVEGNSAIPDRNLADSGRVGARF